MVKVKNYITYIFCMLILSGCTTNLVSQKRAYLINDPKHPDNTNISVPTEIRLARSIKGVNGQIYTCDQPMPDTARADAYGASGGADFTLQDGSLIKQQSSLAGGVNSNTSVLQLNGRSSAVLLARNLMYEMCLSSANGSYEAQKPMFTAMLDVIKTIAEKEQRTAEANQLMAKAFLKPEILENNKTELSGAATWILAKKYHQCMKEAQGDENIQEQKCLAELKQDQKN